MNGLPVTRQLLAAVVCAAMVSGAAGEDLNSILQQLGGRDARQAQRAAQQAQRAAQQANRAAERQDREDACARISAWLANIDSLPPEVQQRRFGGGARPGMAGAAPAALQVPYESWLLEDSRFVPTFGQPFDALPADERDRLQRAGSGCQSPRNARGQATADNMLFYRAFHPQYFPTYAQGVKTIRGARAEVDAALQELQSLRADDTGLQRYRELNAQAQRLSGFLGETRRAEYRQALASANQRVAQVVNAAHGRQAAAQARGYEGLLALVQLQAQMNRDGGAASASNELRARQSEIARELVAQERDRIEALGSGLVGLERGVQWYGEYQTRYAKPAVSVPELREMLTHFEQRRGATLDASQAELSARIVQTRSESELQPLVARYLPLEMDQRRPSGTALLTRVAEWRDELRKRSVLGSGAMAAAEPPPAAPRQRSESTTAARAAPVAERVAAGEPTESEMFDLVKNKLDSAAAEVRNMAESCKGGFSNNDPGKAILCLAGGMGNAAGAGEAMRITKFEKLGCERASGKPGYVCDYLLATSGGAARSMGPSMAAIAGRGGAGQGRFLRTRDGWIAFFGEDNRR